MLGITNKVISIRDTQKDGTRRVEFWVDRQVGGAPNLLCLYGNLIATKFLLK